MKSFSFFSRLLVAPALCLALATPALAADAAADKTAAPAAASAPAAKKPAPTVKSSDAKAPADKKPAAAKTEKTPAPADKKPAAKKQSAAPAKKAPAAPKDAAPAAKKSASAGPANSPEVLQKGLDDFAKNTIATLNRCVVPSSGKKEITKNADGSFTARYIEIDPNSIRTSYKTPDKPGPVSYIGYMSYNESEYHCTAPTKAAAEKGPFTPRNTKMLTELIKHLNGKWTY